MAHAMTLFAHPCPESFSAALHQQTVASRNGAGWDLDDCDLNAEAFQPLLTETKRRAYHDVPDNIAPVSNYVGRIRAAQALVMVFPVWNFGYPAILRSLRGFQAIYFAWCVVQS